MGQCDGAGINSGTADCESMHWSGMTIAAANMDSSPEHRLIQRLAGIDET